MVGKARAVVKMYKVGARCGPTLYVRNERSEAAAGDLNQTASAKCGLKSAEVMCGVTCVDVDRKHEVGSIRSTWYCRASRVCSMEHRRIRAQLVVARDRTSARRGSH